MEAENRSSDVVAAAVELPSVNECQPMEDSQLGGVPVTGSVNSGASGLLEAPAPVNVVAVKAEVGVVATSDGKRKRGRPPKGQGKPMAPKKRKEEDEEEDVCFICFDGGSLVLCDRRGCPKAYHPACIKRDEAFFRSKAKWNCGWHICSSCQKAAHYMCYTCTYSLCKACTRYADYVCVRENKGFCRTCMRTIMLIENNGQGDKEMVQVDFDDKSSWEYLFKVYWVLLKGNLCLTLDELTQAQNPWKAAGSVPSKVKSLDVHYGGNDGKASIPDSTSGHLEANHSERTKDQLNLPKKADSPTTDRSTSDNNSISVGTNEWASKELLEFVAHMRNGNTSILSQFDLQTLLLDYIKINNLRDPRQKSHIICDLRLRNLFGKTRVGHFEMLKLLEFHCLMKEDSRNDVIQGNIVHAVTSQVEGDGNNDNLLMPGKHKYNTRRKGNERRIQPNLDEYAAIDIHNIKLMYLRRDLMESLIVDNGKFHDKVVGSFVRIRILNGDQNQDMYRLVKVVDTCKVEVPYKIGERTADFMLEILNLDKKERITIDAVSNQEFSEDECQRLRQSVKCGLVKRLTVGQVLEKATSLQEVRLNDKLETEIMRLSHLRDRASEKGHKKELRECVEKLELLKTPEERQRRLHEIPEVHADPDMNPNCQSDKYPGVNSNKEQDGHVKSGYSGFGRDGREPYSSRNDDNSYHSGSGVWKELTTCDQRRSISSTFFLDKGASSGVVERKNESLWNEGKDACGSSTSEKPGNQVESSGSVVGGWNNQAGLSGPFSGVGSEASAASLSTGSALPAYDGETDRLWQYRDPNGKIQGPFCMVQLRKWNTTGYFPPDMRIWNINDEENNSLLLTDILNGQSHQVMPMQCVSLPFQGVKGASDSGLYNCDGGRWSGSTNATRTDGKLSEGGWNGSEAVAHSNANNEFINGDGWGSHSSSQTRPVDVQTGSSSQCSDSLNVKNSENPQVCCPAPSFAFTDQSRETSLHQASGCEGQKRNSSPNHGNIIHQTTGGESWGSRPVNYSSNNWDSNSCFASVVNSTETLEKIFGIDINLPSPPPKTSDGDVEDQTTKDQQSVPSDICVPDLNAQNVPSSTSKPIDGEEKADSSIQNMPSPLPKPADEDEKVVASETKQLVSNFPVQDSGPGWSSASRLVMGGGAQLPEIADKWGGYSTARAKPSFEEWDSGFVSSLKPPEVASDHAATPTSKCDELTTPSPPHHSSSWLASVTETIEISTLAEESVSDLLAEVDAMESQGGGLASPTSVNGGEELFHDSKTDCFTSLRGFVPPLDLGRSDASSSTVDVKLPTQPITTAEQIGAPSASRRSGEKSYKSTKMEVDTKPTEPSTISRNTIDTDPAPRARVKPIDTGVGAMQGNTNSGSREGPTQGNTNTGRGTSQGTPRGNSSTNRGTSAGFTGRESHPKHGGERLVSPRDRPLQGRDSGLDRGRSSWSRQSPFGSSGGGSGGNHARPPARGQRVCKFYESGHCKKGAFCNYLHPR